MLEQFQKNNPPRFQHVLRRILLPWRSLTWQIFFLTVVPLTVVVLVIAFGSLSIHQNAMRSLVGERDERAVRTAAAALEEQLTHRIFAIRSLALLVNNQRENTIQSTLKSLEYLEPEFDRGLVVLDQSGKVISGSGNLDFWNTAAVQIEQMADDLYRSEVPSKYLSDTFVSPVENETIVVVMAVSPSQDWIAGGAYSAAEMVHHTLTGAFSSGPEAAVLVLDAERRLVYTSGSHSYSSQIMDQPGITEALSGHNGAIYVMAGSEEHVVAYSPIASTGWALVLEEPWESMSTPTLRTSQLAPLVLVPVLILAVVALWFGAGQIVGPLQSLETRAATLAWGDFTTIEIPVGGIEEIRHLQKELIMMARKVQAAQKSLRGYIGVITTAQEEERRRLAREIHDDTIQALIALKQRLQLFRLNASPGTPEAKALQEIEEMTEQTIEDLRRLTRALRPIYLEDLGLVTALEMQTRETSQTLGIPITFSKMGVEKRLVPSHELALYRMVQEAFSNIARHARAKEAGLVIQFTEEGVTIDITDNGVGFEVPRSPAEFAPAGHYGLLGLYERAELIGADFTIASKPGQGTNLRINLPLA